MRVLIAARDIRVRRALSRALELDGGRIVGATEALRLLPELDDQVGPDVVVLELDGRGDPGDLRVVEELVRRRRAVIAVVSVSTRCAAVLAAGAQACLDKDANFTDRLTQAVRAVAG
ncbi:hypothetical protein ACI797_26415 [Geodermatophilus sp. SYSU D00691]